MQGTICKVKVFVGSEIWIIGFVLFPLFENLRCYTSQPQTFRNDSLGFLLNHNSYGVVSTDFDGALFKVNAAVSNA